MLEDADEGGVRLWHLVKASEEPELPKHRRGSLRERERAKAIPEIYLTRLLSMKVHTPTVRVMKRCQLRAIADLLLDCAAVLENPNDPFCFVRSVCMCVCVKKQPVCALGHTALRFSDKSVLA